MKPSDQGRLYETFPFLRKAEPQFQQIFFEQTTHAHLNKGQYICMQGNQCAHLPLVLSGTARVHKVSQSGRELTLYRIQKGESCVLTASCIMSALEFPAFAVAETDIDALVVSARLFPEWISSYASWRTYVFDLVARRLAGVIELVEEVAFRQMDSRLASYLLSHTEGAGSSIHRTHEAVAVDLGTSREVVSRLLKDFEQAKMVTLSRGEIGVISESGLQGRT